MYSSSLALASRRVRAVHEFGLERAKALRGAMVEAITLAAHDGFDAIESEQFAVVTASILHTAIGLVDQPHRRPAVSDRLADWARLHSSYGSRYTRRTPARFTRGYFANQRPASLQLRQSGYISISIPRDAGAGAAGLHKEGFLGRKVGMVGFHRRDHGIKGAALKRMHG